MNYPKVTCPCCQKKVSVQTDGRLWRHNDEPGWPCNCSNAKLSELK